MSKTTLLPQYVSIIQNTSLDFYLKSNNLLTAIGGYLAELNQNIKFTESLVTTNTLSSFGSLYNELNNTNFTVEDFTVTNGEVVPQGTKEMDNIFKMFFVEKYLSLTDEYKKVVDTYIKDNNFFKPFSDDIGVITDIQSIVDNNVNPYFDVFNQQFILQTNIPPTLNKKISRDEMKINKSFSYYGDSLLKLNLVGLQEGDLNDNTAKTSHETNLITDVLYYGRALQNQQNFLNTINVVLGVISGFVLFFKGLNPKSKDINNYAILSKYTITNLEGLQTEVDILKNTLNKVQVSSKDVLGV